MGMTQGRQDAGKDLDALRQGLQLRAPSPGPNGEPPSKRVEGQEVEARWQGRVVGLVGHSELYTIALVSVQFFLERVDKYGAVINIGPGDSTSIAVTTEIGLGVTKSERLATSVGMSLTAWVASVETSISQDTGRSTSITRKEAETYTKTYGNADRQGRDRLISLWKHGVAVRTKVFTGGYFKETIPQTMAQSLLAFTDFWKTEERGEFYLPGLMHSERYLSASAD